MKIIAHRGYWKSEGAAQNSRNAILAAIKEGFDGIEVDIRMSKDGVLYLNHDVSFKNCIIHETNSSVLDQLKLASGENITRFDEFIKIVKKIPELTLFIEIKDINSQKYRKIITRKLIKQLRSNNLIQNTVLLCFDIRVLRLALFIEPKLPRMLLREHLDSKFYKIRLNRINAIGVHYELLLKHPELIAKYTKLGLEINVWTVNKIDEAGEIVNFPITYITTDIPNELLKITSGTLGTK